jgi:hypothetical protein
VISNGKSKAGSVVFESAEPAEKRLVEAAKAPLSSETRNAPMKVETKPVIRKKGIEYVIESEKK